MKKLFSLFMAVMLLISLSACKVNTTSSENGLTSDFSDGEFLVEGTGNASEDDAASNDGAGGQSGSGSGGADGTVSTPVKPNEGTVSMLEGLDFGGKTFTFAYRSDNAPDDDEKARLKAFGKEFNCTVKATVIPFDTYMDAVAKKIVADQPYDVVFLHGSHMPSCIINDLVVPLDDYFTTADVADSTHPEKGGISLVISEYFKGKDGKLYGVSDGVNCSVGYYNKQALADAGYSGNKDPYYLWTQGKWTWDAFEEMAKAMSNPSKGIYFTPTISESLVATTGHSHISRTGNASYSINLGLPEVFTAMSRLQKWAVTDKIIDASLETCQDSYDDFANGKFAMLAETPDNHISTIKEAIATKKSAAWNGGDLSLLGLVPVPQQKEGTTYIPATWPCAIGASKGAKEPKVAVAYAIYKSIPSNQSYTDTYALTESEQEFFNSLYSDYDLVFDYYGFRNSTTTGYTELHNMRKEIRNGADVKSTLDKYQSVLEGLRDGALKDWK